MPTGYTAGIADGITFEEYAMRCARAFGALVMMRDDPTDAPIPDKFEPSPYYEKSLTEAKAELARLRMMTAEQATAAAVDAYIKAENERAAYLSRATALRAKYEAMLEKVRAWPAPTPDHVEYKSFMESQILSSIDGDCSTSYYQPPQRMIGSEWLIEALAKAQQDITYYATERAKEYDCTDSRNRWIAALRNSLKTKEAA